MENKSSSISSEKRHPPEVTDIQQANLDSNLLEPKENITTDTPRTETIFPTESPSARSATGTDDLPHIQSEKITTNTQRAEITFYSCVTPENTGDVDKKSVHVVCAGKTKIFFIFPAEKMSVLLQEACNWAGKKPEKMNLVFKGEQLDVMKAVSEYPSLRGGSKVYLIRAS